MLDIDTESAAELASLRFKGYGANIGVSYDVAGGTLALGLGYADGKAYYQDEKRGDFKIRTALLGYSYEFSKRTNLYIALGQTQNKLSHSQRLVHNTTQAVLGLAHTF